MTTGKPFVLNPNAKNKLLQNSIKQLKNNVKRSNLTLLKLRNFPRTFMTFSDYSKTTLFLRTSLLGHLFYHKLVLLMNWMQPFIGV